MHYYLLQTEITYLYVKESTMDGHSDQMLYILNVKIVKYTIFGEIWQSYVSQNYCK